MLVTRPSARKMLNTLVSTHFHGRPISLLEAGGGSTTKLDVDLLQLSSITTIDISPEQLAQNSYADFKILGDLQDFTTNQTYELVVIYNVLEHIPRADHAIENLVKACAEDGLIVVGSPYKYSFSGLVTWLTPHWFHVFFYRYILGSKDAGSAGAAPFRTHFHPMTLPKNLERYLLRRGYACEFMALYEGNVYDAMMKRKPIIGASLKFITMILNALTPKHYNARHGDYYAVFRNAAGQGLGEVPDASAKAPAPG